MGGSSALPYLPLRPSPLSSKKKVLAPPWVAPAGNPSRRQILLPVFLPWPLPEGDAGQSPRVCGSGAVSLFLELRWRSPARIDEDDGGAAEARSMWAAQRQRCPEAVRPCSSVAGSFSLGGDLFPSGCCCVVLCRIRRRGLAVTASRRRRRWRPRLSSGGGSLYK